MSRPLHACTIEGCGRSHYGRGWCVVHWTRWRRTGSTELRLREPDAIPWCECAEPRPYAGPLMPICRHVPLPGQCTRCRNPVYEALVASLGEREGAVA